MSLEQLQRQLQEASIRMMGEARGEDGPDMPWLYGRADAFHEAAEMVRQALEEKRSRSRPTLSCRGRRRG